MSKMHTLKSRFLPGYLRAQATGARTFEIRKNDRNFKIGDELWLREYNSETKAYTDNGLIVDILHISPYMQKENHVILETKLKVVMEKVDAAGRLAVAGYCNAYPELVKGKNLKNIFLKARVDENVLLYQIKDISNVVIKVDFSKKQNVEVTAHDFLMDVVFKN